MEIYYDSTKLAHDCNDPRRTIRKWGKALAHKIHQRLAELHAAETLAVVSHLPPLRCHELTNNRAGQFAVVLKDRWRLIFVPHYRPVPKNSDGGIDRAQVRAIRILEVEDYHDE